jgi:hypothetical protein
MITSLSAWTSSAIRAAREVAREALHVARDHAAHIGDRVHGSNDTTPCFFFFFLAI